MHIRPLVSWDGGSGCTDGIRSACLSTRVGRGEGLKSCRQQDGINPSNLNPSSHHVIKASHRTCPAAFAGDQTPLIHLLARPQPHHPHASPTTPPTTLIRSPTHPVPNSSGPQQASDQTSIHQTSTKRAPNMHQTCTKHASNMHQTSIKQAPSKHPSNVHQTCIKHASNMYQTCIKHADFGGMLV